jgi:hypothetical protein
MDREELILFNAFLGVIDNLWSCISPSANDKVWHQPWSLKWHTAKSNPTETKHPATESIRAVKCLNVSSLKQWAPLIIWTRGQSYLTVNLAPQCQAQTCHLQLDSIPMAMTTQQL